MAINYTTLQVQLGAVLKIARKKAAFIEHVFKSDNASYNSRLLKAANGYSDSLTVEKDAYGEQIAFFKSMETDMRTKFDQYRAQVESAKDLFGVIANGLALSANQIEPGAITYEYDGALTDGTILLVNRNGVLGNLHKDMLTQGQWAAANTMTPGAFTAVNGNRGLINVTTMGYLSQMPTGTLVFECVQATVDSCRIAVFHECPIESPRPDGTRVKFAQNVITAEKQFEDYRLGLIGPVVLTRPGLVAPTKTGDAAGPLFTAAGTFTTPNENDMNGGVLQVRVTRQATSGQEWLIEFFSDSSRTVKVGAVVTGTLVGTFAVDIVLRNRTRFQQTFDRAAAAVDLAAAGDDRDTISFDIETPQVGDKWTRAITNGRNNNFVNGLGDLWDWTPPTAGANQWTEANAAPVAMT